MIIVSSSLQVMVHPQEVSHCEAGDHMVDCPVPSSFTVQELTHVNLFQVDRHTR